MEKYCLGGRMVILEEFMAEGSERKVYRHPHFSERVVKIKRDDAEIDRNAVEYAFYRASNPPGDIGIPRMFGWVDTNLGPGLAFELVCDPNGTPSMNLARALANGVLTPREGVDLLDDFFDEALRRGLIIYDDNPRNFLFRPDLGRLILVDGFGPRCWNWRNWFRSNFRVLARKRIRLARTGTLNAWQRWCDQVVCTVPRP